MTDLENRTWPARASEDPQYKDKAVTRALGASTRMSFVSRGFVMCKELGFHGINRPIPADESRITALAVAGPHRVFGATSGKRSHLFMYCRGATEGVVIDLGVVEGATDLSRSLVAWDRGAAFVGTSPAPGRIMKCQVGRFSSDCVQEWGQSRVRLEEIAVPIPEEGIACLVGDSERGRLYGLSDRSGTLFCVDAESGEASIIGEVDEVRHFSRTLLLSRDGTLYGAGALGRIFRYERDSSAGAQPLDISVPCAAGRALYARVDSWAQDEATGVIYGGTEADGILFAFDPQAMTVRSLGRPTGDPRIRAITVGKNGIVYGVSGDVGSIGHLFAYDPRAGSLDDLGIPLATVEIRRYGYEFDAAATGPDGEIYLGESDRGGCLFVYFPPISRPPG